jgi:hypothetical protein
MGLDSRQLTRVDPNLSVPTDRYRELQFLPPPTPSFIDCSTVNVKYVKSMQVVIGSLPNRPRRADSCRNYIPFFYKRGGQQ